MRNISFFLYGVVLAGCIVASMDHFSTSGSRVAGRASDLRTRHDVVSSQGREDLIRQAYTWEKN